MRMNAGGRGTAQHVAEVRRVEDAQRAARVVGSSLLADDTPKAVAALKQEDGKDLYLVGSSELTRTLIEHDLVDEFRVMINPLVVGGGKRVFPDDGVLRSLRLVEGQVTGALLATH